MSQGPGAETEARRLRLETAAGSAAEIRRGLRFGAIWGHVDDCSRASSIA